MVDGELSSGGHGRPELLGNQMGDLCKIDILLHPDGIFNRPKSFLHFALPRLQLQLAVIFLLTQSLHLLLRRFHLPRVISELLAGIILGPSILGQNTSFHETLFPEEGDACLSMLGKIGFVLYIFLSGVKMDPKKVMKTGSKAYTIGVVAAMAPVFFGLVFFSKVEKAIDSYRKTASVNIVGMQNSFAFPVIASMLVDLKIMNSELGRLALASALISDLFSAFIISAYAVESTATYAFKEVLKKTSFILTSGLILLIICVGQTVSQWIIQNTPEGKPVNRAHIILMTLLVLIVVILADNITIPYQYGPFIFGLVVPDGPPLGSTLVDKLEPVTSGFLTPILISYCGLKMNLIEIYDLKFMAWIWLFVGLFFIVKLLAIFCPAIMCKVPAKDAAALACIMSTQGNVQIAFYYHDFVLQVFDRETFSMLNVAVLILILTSHLTAKWLYDDSIMYTGYQKRDIQHTSPDSELRVVTCAHRIDDVLAVRKLIEAYFPTKESPLSVYALHLVELVGQATPLLVDHQLGQKSSNIMRTQKMIEVLHAYEQQYLGFLSVQQYTSFSLTKFMHYDVCSIAFDKLASLIILPFHKKWNQQGKLVLDSSILRSVNTNVLINAPCSVSILVDRNKILGVRQLSTVYNVGLAFFGGTDDREGLAFARRMVQSTNVHLTVVRFVSLDLYASDNQWDTMLDAEILKELRMQGSLQNNITYKEEKVKDGVETAFLIHQMEDAFDLIIVGRHHNENMPQLLGLGEWNDLPELGPVGDMLAASDLNKPVSVMVMQHQLVKKTLLGTE